jgi:serine/threonine protein kinase
MKHKVNISTKKKNFSKPMKNTRRKPRRNQRGGASNDRWEPNGAKEALMGSKGMEVIFKQENKYWFFYEAMTDLMLLRTHDKEKFNECFPKKKEFVQLETNSEPFRAIAYRIGTNNILCVYVIKDGENETFFISSNNPNGFDAVKWLRSISLKKQVGNKKNVDLVSYITTQLSFGNEVYYYSRNVSGGSFKKFTNTDLQFEETPTTEVDKLMEKVREIKMAREQEKEREREMKTLVEQHIELEDELKYKKIKIEGGYTYKKYINEGNFGVIHEFEKEGQSFAVKFPRVYEEKTTPLDPDTIKININDLIEEQRIIKNINIESPFLSGIISSSEIFPVHMVLDYCPTGSFDFLCKKGGGRYISKVLQIYFYCQAAMGLQALHDKNYIHRDIGARNIILCGDNSAVNVLGRKINDELIKTLKEKFKLEDFIKMNENSEFLSLPVAKIIDFGKTKKLEETKIDHQPREKIPIKWFYPSKTDKAYFNKFTDGYAFLCTGVEFFEGKFPYSSQKNEKLLVSASTCDSESSNCLYSINNMWDKTLNPFYVSLSDKLLPKTWERQKTPGKGEITDIVCKSLDEVLDKEVLDEEVSEFNLLKKLSVVEVKKYELNLDTEYFNIKLLERKENRQPTTYLDPGDDGNNEVPKGVIHQTGNDTLYEGGDETPREKAEVALINVAITDRPGLTISVLKQEYQKLEDDELIKKIEFYLEKYKMKNVKIGNSVYNQSSFSNPKVDDLQPLVKKLEMAYDEFRKKKNSIEDSIYGVGLDGRGLFTPVEGQKNGPSEQKEPPEQKKPPEPLYSEAYSWKSLWSPKSESWTPPPTLGKVGGGRRTKTIKRNKTIRKNKKNFTHKKLIKLLKYNRTQKKYRKKSIMKNKKGGGNKVHQNKIYYNLVYHGKLGYRLVTKREEEKIDIEVIGYDINQKTFSFDFIIPNKIKIINLWKNLDGKLREQILPEIYEGIEHPDYEIDVNLFP